MKPSTAKPDPAPQFDIEDAPATPPPAAQTADERRAAEIAAIHADRLEQAATHTRFDAAMFVRKEQR